MLVSFSCNHCGHVLKVAESQAGKQGKCKQCGNHLTVPAAEPAAPPRDLYGLEETTVEPAGPALPRAGGQGAAVGGAGRQGWPSWTIALAGGGGLLVGVMLTMVFGRSGPTRKAPEKPLAAQTGALPEPAAPIAPAAPVVESAPGLKRDGAFGFPQAEAEVLCDQKDLRLSAWNNAETLFVQAIVWGDDDDAGERGIVNDPRPVGDTSALMLDVDADQEETAKVDRNYYLNPFPRLPGLRHSVVVRKGVITRLSGDSKGRGAIQYLDGGNGQRVRVDSFAIPLAELRKRPGERIRLAYWASSPKPSLILNSVGYENEQGYFAFHLPKANYHEITLSGRTAPFDIAQVPEGRETTDSLAGPAGGPNPTVGPARPGADPVRLRFFSTGAFAKAHFYRPHKIDLKHEKPQGLTRTPNLAAPRFGVLSFGARESPMRLTVAIDEPEGQPSMLYVDSNANGDLTDDPAAEWKFKVRKDKDGKEVNAYSGGASINLALGGKTVAAHLVMYNNGTASLMYYPDYGYEGAITLGALDYKAMLIDNGGTADFRAADGLFDTSFLLIDVNQNGRFEFTGERFDVRKPFNIKGTTYEIAGMDASGAGFQIRSSDKTVAEIAIGPPPPARTDDPGVGQPALKFNATTTDGQPINFPSSYAGKLVMLDFWATWCGPCIGELPHLTRAYDRFHDQGFEILGISLDRQDAGEKLAAFTRAKNMAWRQVYDGKYWKAEVADLYGVHSIPKAYLVDGDTGEVLATGTSLRGDQLEQTLAEKLEKKGLLKPGADAKAASGF